MDGSSFARSPRGSPMKARDAMIAWTPSAWTHLPSAGRVAVGPFKRSGRGGDGPYGVRAGGVNRRGERLRAGKLLSADLGSSDGWVGAGSGGQARTPDF